MKIKLFTLFIFIIFGVSHTNAQDDLKIMSKTDSIFFSKPYPYILPILGDKAHNTKVRMPLPIGVMFNALVGTQYLSLDNMQLGFGNVNSPDNPEMIDLSEFVTFEDITAQTSTYNLRFDTWVLPFLNVYGIVGKTKKANISVTLIDPIPLSVTTEVSGTYVGYGMMAAGAVGPLFISLDANQTYSFNPRLDDPAKVSIAGLRTGPVFKFKNNPKMNITLWAGAMYTNFNSETVGSIRATELAPDAPARIDEMITNLNDWYDNLSPADQLKYYIPYTKLNNGLENIQDSVNNGYIRYSFDKKINNPWNMLIGAQWQINYRWQMRAEAQFLGDRTAGLFSLNYRFGIKGKNWFSKNNM
ncbi:hypothetical protein [Hanstruepera marina]|uniref:hypothetical protein n=1 Tax=Hanstruepera marina TaxID=2873265 RepID=UPI001CA69DFE|nr:hypothetical protein [Hanstruepera marina]